MSEFLAHIFGAPVHPLRCLSIWLAEREGGQTFADWLWAKSEQGAKVPKYLSQYGVFCAQVFAVRVEAAKFVASEASYRPGTWCGLDGLPRVCCKVEGTEWRWQIEGVTEWLDSRPEIDIAQIWADAERDWLPVESSDALQKRAEHMINALQRLKGRGYSMETIFTDGFNQVPMRTLMLPVLWWEGVEEMLGMIAARESVT